MGMRTVNDPYGDLSVLVDTVFGASYDAVRSVANNIDYVKKVSNLFDTSDTIVSNIHQRYVSAEGQSEFELPVTVVSEALVTVFVNGKWKSPSATFSAYDTTLFFNQALAQGDVVDVMIVSSETFDVLQKLKEDTEQIKNEAQTYATAAGSSASTAVAAVTAATASANSAAASATLAGEHATNAGIAAEAAATIVTEGDFAPTLAFATPGNSVIAHTVQTGWFQKVGSLVQLHMRVDATITKGTASGRLRMYWSDLPYPAAATTIGAGIVRYKPVQITMPSGTIAMVPWVVQGSKYLELMCYRADSGSALPITATEVTDGAMRLEVHVSYHI